MADNLYRDKAGRHFICFQDLSGIQRKIRLTGLNKRDADSFASRFRELLSSVKAGLVPSAVILEWAAKLDSRFQKVLQKFGLVSAKPVAQLTLREARDKYLELKAGKKPSTRRNILTASERLFKILGHEALVSSLTKGLCEKAVAILQATHAQGSVSQSIKKTKAILGHLVDLEIIAKSPMAHISPGPDAGDPDLLFFVTREMADRVLEACPDCEWRLIFGLARYGGIRIPSELVPLTWADVRWDEHKIYVRSSKTEHHRGKKARWVPIFPELRPLLREAFDQAADKNGPVQARFRDPEDDNPRTEMCRIIVSAGIEPWPKPFTNLRATRDTELRRAGVPDYKVDAWLGHSLKVAKKHYLQLIDEDYLIAAGLGALPAVSPASAPEVPRASKSSPMPKGVVLYDRDLKKRMIGSSVNWAFGGPKWQAGGKNLVESGKKKDKESTCNTLQAVTQSPGVDGFVRDSASDCSLLQEIKAPRLGLEPRTCELTARRSTN